MNELLKLKHTQAEIECWKRVCDELKNVGVDIGMADNLNSALINWGERLSQLREFTGQVYTYGRQQIY